MAQLYGASYTSVGTIPIGYRPMSTITITQDAYGSGGNGHAVAI